jgi:hypothetical protein
LIDPASTFGKDDLNNNVAGTVTYSGLTSFIQGQILYY